MTCDEQPSFKNCFPWVKLPDLILFGLMFVLIALVAWLNHWDLVNTLTASLFGAIIMYIKGEPKEPPKP
jgi:hypothetical protein